jgi:UDP-N-acetylglucosamine/UDP-N-acetylgalactosamine diphosphorylase
MEINRKGLNEALHSLGQGHLVRHAESLSELQRSAFYQELAGIEWEELQNIYQPPDVSNAGAPRVVTLAERSYFSDCTELGEAAYRSGEVAILMVAGGQGTRLNFHRPKGCYPLGPLSGRSIYGLQAEKVVALSERLNRPVRLLVQTSPQTDEETRTFFRQHEYFGLTEGQVSFFVQGTVPTLTEQGQALLAAPGRLLKNPDGHGGVIAAFTSSGLFDSLKREGIRHLVYIQVDNVLSRIDDPFAVGLKIKEDSDVLTKVLKKAGAGEKVGVLCKLGSRDRIVEYSDLSTEQKEATDEGGELKLKWGSPALHIFGMGVFERYARAGSHLPFHLAVKKVRYFDGSKESERSAVKRERFVFDVLAGASNIGLEIERSKEFNPVKDADGNDSPKTARRMMSDVAREWIESIGVDVELPSGCYLEISPAFAATKEQFLAKREKLRNFPGEIRSNLLIERSGEVTCGAGLFEEIPSR